MSARSDSRLGSDGTSVVKSETSSEKEVKGGAPTEEAADQGAGKAPMHDADADARDVVRRKSSSKSPTPEETKLHLSRIAQDLRDDANAGELTKADTAALLHFPLMKTRLRTEFEFFISV